MYLFMTPIYLKFKYNQAIEKLKNFKEQLKPQKKKKN